MAHESISELDPWAGDLLGREAEALHVQRYLENVYRDIQFGAESASSFVLNVNSEWGSGKTWFLERLAKQIGVNHPVVFFNAWQNDFTKDPLLSFVSVICSELSEQYSNNVKIKKQLKNLQKSLTSIYRNALPIAAAIAAKQLVGNNLSVFLTPEKTDLKDDVVDASASLAKIAASCVVKDFSEKKSAIKKFEEAVNALIVEISKQNIQLPLFIFIDELDRCRPTYAIELLESIKHLFNLRGVFFVVASDTRQLSHSIKVIYGQDFNSISYLKRFFYIEYNLADPDYKSMAKFLFKDLDGSALFMPKFVPNLAMTLEDFFAKVAELFGLSVRDQEHVMRILKTILLTTEVKRIHFVFLLLLICVKHKAHLSFDNISTNNLLKELERVFVGKETRTHFNDVKIAAMQWNGSNTAGSNKTVALMEVIVQYLQLIGKPYEALSVYISQYSQFEYVDEVASELRQSYLGIKSQNDNLPQAHLAIYLKLLHQSGRFSVSS